MAEPEQTHIDDTEEAALDAAEGFDPVAELEARLAQAEAERDEMRDRMIRALAEAEKQPQTRRERPSRCPALWRVQDRARHAAGL